MWTKYKPTLKCIFCGADNSCGPIKNWEGSEFGAHYIACCGDRMDIVFDADLSLARKKW